MDEGKSHVGLDFAKWASLRFQYHLVAKKKDSNIPFLNFFPPGIFCLKPKFTARKQSTLHDSEIDCQVF
jgi:hypothetical protein